MSGDGTTVAAIKVAVLGTGIMGAPMAANLLAAGFPVTVWNRSAEKARALVARGAASAPDARSALETVDIAITMLADGPTVDAVLFGPDHAAHALRPGGLLIDMSSIPPATARTLAERLAARGIGYLDAPVSGGEVGAKAGTLAIMAGGTQADFDRALPVFAPLGRATRVGPAGAGQVAKLCNQAIVGITIGAVAEALLLAEAAGADPRAVQAALAGGFADSRILQIHGGRMIDRTFVPGGKVSTQLKDMATIVGLAREHGLELPFSELTRGLYETLVGRGDGGKDHAALFLEIAARNGRG